VAGRQHGGYLSLNAYVRGWQAPGRDRGERGSLMDESKAIPLEVPLIGALERALGLDWMPAMPLTIDTPADREIEAGE